MIKVSQLLKTVPTADGDLTILHGVDLEIVAGASAAIVGASGSGKSTLLGLLAGMDVASAGEVWLDGVNLSALDEDARARLRAEKVGFVFQNFQLLPALTAKENVMLPLFEHTKLDRKTMEIMTRMKLQVVELGGFENLMPSELSGGMIKRAALARALALDPDIVFLDEPTSGLDVSVQARLLDLLRGLVADLGLAAIVVTHDLAVARLLSHRMIVMKGGDVVEAGLTDRVLDDPQAPYTQLLVSSILQV